MVDVPDAAEMSRLARTHWAEHRPLLTARLKQTGGQEEMIQAAVNQTLDGMAVLIARGMTPLEAWQVMREEWLLPPPEETESDNA